MAERKAAKTKAEQESKLKRIEKDLIDDGVLTKKSATDASSANVMSKPEVASAINDDDEDEDIAKLEKLQELEIQGINQLSYI